MPGAYAHLTLANIAGSPAELDKMPSFPAQATKALGRYLKFCELGAVSPDYPYLVLGDKDANAWADVMHYEQTGAILREGVRRVAEMEGETKSKCMAWLMGFASHVIGDVTIHPVVQRKVGPYDENKKEHRICEMNQDSYIFNRLNIGRIETAEYLKSGIMRCGTKEGLDPEVRGLWSGLLKEIHPTVFQSNPPNMDDWHRSFVSIMDSVDDAGRLPAFARHVTAGIGLTYPHYGEVDRSYIEELETPTGEGGTLGYDKIFDMAVMNVRSVWQIIASGVYSGDETLASSIKDWNLDTGMEVPGGKQTYWG